MPTQHTRSRPHPARRPRGIQRLPHPSWDYGERTAPGDKPSADDFWERLGL